VRVLHFWSKGRHVGDFFYARAQQAVLRQILGQVEIYESSCARHNPGDKGISRDDLMQPADVVIVGGGPLYDFLGGPGNLFVSKHDLIACQKPVLVWSTGLDAKLDANGQPILWDAPCLPHVDALHSVARSAAVRDTATQQWLKGRGYRSVVTGDAAHFLRELQPVTHKDGPVLFSWRHDICEPLAEIVMEWVGWARKQGLKVQAICLSEADARSASFLHNVDYIHRGQEVNYYADALAGASAVLGCRVHAAIVALIQGTPAHCYYHTSRIKSWADDFFEEEWISPLADISLEGLCAITEELLSGDLKRFNPFTQRVKRLRELTQRWIEQNFEV